MTSIEAIQTAMRVLLLAAKEKDQCGLVLSPGNSIARTGENGLIVVIPDKETAFAMLGMLHQIGILGELKHNNGNTL